MSSWVDGELQSLDLHDKRRNDRIKRMVSMMAQRPTGSIPQTFTTRAESEAAYRALNSESTDPEAIRQAVREACVARMTSVDVVLATEDTTVFNFTAHPATEGLGPIGHSQLSGFFMHSVLAVSDEGVPLGLMHQQVWARDPKARGTQPRPQQRPFAEKESARWVQSQRVIHQAIPAKTTVIKVADREADLFELFAEPRPENAELLIRACYDRCVSQEQKHLWAAAEAAPVCGEFAITLRRPSRPPREARLQVRFCPVTLQPPRSGVHDPNLEPVALTAILVREIEASDDEEPVTWLLLTTLEVRDFERARECVRYYSLRWLVERYHFTLKSGCKIEESQLRTREALERLLCLYAIVAWRLLWMTYAARVEGDQPCTVAFTTLEWQTLWRLQHDQGRLAKRPPPLRDAIRWTASLAGFLGRKGDGEPGVKRLWRGLMRLQDIVIGVLLLQTPQDVRNA